MTAIHEISNPLLLSIMDNLESLPNLPDTPTMVPRGSLFNLGPDGLGFIIPEDEPSRSYAFSIRNLRDIHVATFDEAGLHDGDTVVFHLNAKRQVDRLDPVTTP